MTGRAPRFLKRMAREDLLANQPAQDSATNPMGDGYPKVSRIKRRVNGSLALLLRIPCIHAMKIHVVGVLRVLYAKQLRLSRRFFFSRRIQGGSGPLTIPSFHDAYCSTSSFQGRSPGLIITRAPDSFNPFRYPALLGRRMYSGGCRQ